MKFAKVEIIIFYILLPLMCYGSVRYHSQRWPDLSFDMMSILFGLAGWFMVILVYIMLRIMWTWTE
jgi:hypothetical protein